MASLIYNSYWDDTVRALIDNDGNTFYCMLVTSAYTENKDTHTKRSDVTNEVTGTGYTANGVAVTATVTKDTTNDRVDIAFAAASWSSSTITAAKAVYYQSLGGAASADRLVAVNDFGGNVISTNGTFTVAASTVRIQN